MLLDERRRQNEAGAMTVAEYDAAEQSAMGNSCNRIIGCAKPSYFLHFDYPIAVKEDRELARYADVMHEGRLDLFIELLHGLTEEEFDLFREVNRYIAEFTESRYLKRKVAGAALLSSIYVLRYLRTLYPPGSTILELGPGCGYLGALLVMTGYAYVASDVTQAFYVYQNHLLTAVTGGRLVELATDPRALADLKEIAPGTAVHVPWWKYVVPEPIFAFQVDCVTPNHMLCEMSNIALSYNLRMWSQLGSDIVFDSWGSEVSTPSWLVAKRFTEAGFVFAHSDSTINVLVTGSSLYAAGGYRLPNQERTPSELFNNLKGYGDTGFQRIYRPPFHRSEKNAASRKIIESEKAPHFRGVIGAAEVRAFLSERADDGSIETADEAFFRFIGYGTSVRVLG